MNNKLRKIAIPNYYGIGKHIYKDQLGFQKVEREEAKSDDTRDIFRFEVEEVGLNLEFYYPKTDTFYGIHRERIPIRVKVLPRDRSKSEFIGWQCDSDTHDEPVEVIAVFDKAEDIWDNLKIDGRSLGEVIEESYITALN